MEALTPEKLKEFRKIALGEKEMKPSKQLLKQLHFEKAVRQKRQVKRLAKALKIY